MTRLFVLVLLFHINGMALAGPAFEGCYTRVDDIADFSSGQVSSATSWIRISKGNPGGYQIKGVIVGANFHVCHLVPEEGAELDSKISGNNLVFSYKDISFDMNCKLVLTLNDEILQVQDENYHCKRLFACGTRVSLNGISLRPGGRECE